MVFQMRDDVLDVIATEAELGKAPGQDLAEGIYTLPCSTTLTTSRAHVCRSFSAARSRRTSREEARAAVAASPGIVAASDLAHDVSSQLPKPPQDFARAGRTAPMETQLGGFLIWRRHCRT